MVGVSVILPTHRRPDHLDDAVGSVLQQTYEQFELIVVYEESQPETAEILESIHDERLRTVGREKPEGPSAARNAGLEAATGQYIIFLDDDDRLFETAIETLVETIQRQPANCAGVYAGRVNSYPSGRTRTLRVSEGCVDTYENASVVAPSCALFLKEAVDEIGGFDESFPAAEDHDLVIRLLSNFCLFYLDEILYKRRHHDDQITEDPKILLKGAKILLRKHWKTLTDITRANRTARVAEHYCKIGERKKAKQTIQYVEELIEASVESLSEADIAEVHHRLAHIEAKLGDAPAARVQLRRAIKQSGLNKEYWFYWFWLLFGPMGYEFGRKIEDQIYKPIAVRLGR